MEKLKELEHMIFNVPLDKQNKEELKVKYAIYKNSIARTIKHYNFLKDSYKRLNTFLYDKNYMYHTDEKKMLFIQDEIDHTNDFIAELYEVKDES